MVVASENATLQSSPGPAIALLQPGSGPVELQPVSGPPNAQLQTVLGLANAQLQLLPIGENATGETAIVVEATTHGPEANASMSTEIIPALISFESTAATNQTHLAALAVIAQEIPSPKDNGEAKIAHSHGKGHHPPPPTPTTAECDCPDFMTGRLYKLNRYQGAVFVVDSCRPNNLFIL